jgi:hypothetical protein
MIAYSAVHNWRLMITGVAPDMALWAGLGVLALELSALALPVALHWWTHSPLQRLAAFAFYGLDLGLIFLNVILDYAVNTGAGGLPDWLLSYKFYAMPATPVFAGLGWSVLFLLDPSQRERSMIETLRASTREVLAKRIALQARSADVGESVDQAAAVLARDIVTQTLGVSLGRNAPPGQVVEGKLKDGPMTRLKPRKPEAPRIDTFNAETAGVEEGQTSGFFGGNGRE